MIIHLYTFGWNEMSMLGFFFRHYERFVDRFYFYDDGSTDGTIEFLRSKPNVEIRRFPYEFADSFSQSAGAFREACWKESRGVADWVMLPDVDEHLYHPRMRDYLRRCRRRGVTCIPALGFEMVTDDFPAADERLVETRKLGAPHADYSKLRVFNPDAVASLGFGPGAHRAAPLGRVVLPERDELLLLHYKQLGRDYVSSRHQGLGARLRERDIRNQWGFQYLFGAEEHEANLAGLKARLIDLADPTYRPSRDHLEERWWRPALPDGEPQPIRRRRRSLLGRLRTWLGL